MSCGVRVWAKWVIVPGAAADDVGCASRQCSVAWPFFLVFIYAKISFNRWKLFRKTSWPSGLRRCVQVAVLIGAGSNPADVTFYSLGPAACLLAFEARRLAVRSITAVCSLLETTTIVALPLFCQAFFAARRPSVRRPPPGVWPSPPHRHIVMLAHFFTARPPHPQGRYSVPPRRSRTNCLYTYT